MAISKVYDINIYIEDDELRMVAYKLMIDSNNNLTADTSSEGQTGETFTRKLSDKRSRGIISYLLDLDEWEMRGNWDGYDWWHTTDYLQEGDTPAPIKEWYESLDPYVIRIESEA